MNFKYQIRKKWCGFWQKYKLQNQIKNVRKLFIFLFIAWLFGSFLTIISQWFFFADYHKSGYEYLKYFWYVIIELVSGFDIPSDEIPLHFVSQIISILMLVMGIVVVGLFTGQIISMFVHVLQRSEYFPEKPDNFQFESPIILCGASNKLYNIIRDLKKSRYTGNREIVIVDEKADKIPKFANSKFEDVWYVKGNPGDRNILKKAIGKKDCRVIIFSKQPHEKHSTDASSINTALAIEAFDESVQTVVEIPKNQDASCYEITRVNDWINVSEFSLKLISQAALQPGLAKIYGLLLGSEFQDHTTTQIYFSATPLSAIFCNKSYREISILMQEKFDHLELTLIGFAKYLSPEEKQQLNLTLRNTNYFIQINPIHFPAGSDDPSKYVRRAGRIFFTKYTRLNQDDKLIFIAQNRINFEKYQLTLNNNHGDS